MDHNWNIQFYYTAFKGCVSIVFTNGALMGRRPGVAGDRKISLSRLHLKNHDVQEVCTHLEYWCGGIGAHHHGVTMI